jgi:hypothetical protein
VADYSCSLETLFLQSMSCCPLPQIYDGISCLQFCDTLSTHLGVDLGRALACAKEILQFSLTSALTEKLTSRSYFAKLARFGRFITQPPATDGNSLHDSASAQAESKIQHPLTIHRPRNPWNEIAASHVEKQLTLSSSSTSRVRRTQASASPAFADQFTTTRMSTTWSRIASSGWG